MLNNCVANKFILLKDMTGYSQVMETNQIVILFYSYTLLYARILKLKVNKWFVSHLKCILLLC